MRSGSGAKGGGEVGALRQPRRSGQSLILAVLAMTVIMGMAVTGIDVGRVFSETNQDQAATTAAALAGAKAIADAENSSSANPATFTQTATTDATDAYFVNMGYAQAYKSVGANPVVSVVENPNGTYTVTVTSHIQTSLIFGPAIGIGHLDISRKATAVAGPPTLAAPAGLQELGMPAQGDPVENGSFTAWMVGQTYSISSENFKFFDGTGNWGGVRLSSLATDAAGYYEAGTALTKPGIDVWPSAATGEVMTFPVIQNTSNKNGETTVTVSGFITMKVTATSCPATSETGDTQDPNQDHSGSDDAASGEDHESESEGKPGCFMATVVASARSIDPNYSGIWNGTGLWTVQLVSGNG